MNPTTTIDVSALKDKSHPKFHLTFGQIFSLAILGLHAYQIQDQPKGSPEVLLQPQNLLDISNGVLSIINQPTEVPVVDSTNS